MNPTINLEKNSDENPAEELNALQTSVTNEDSPRPLCPRVHTLASEIYKEFEALVAMHGNKFLRNLMPLVVTALENLDALYVDKEELQINFTLTREDHKHLLSEYEKEKRLRKAAETKLLKMEDMYEEERKVFNSKIDHLESTMKTLEVKVKNSAVSLCRAEERESELLKENDSLRSRYNDLLRHFTVYVERTKSQGLENNVEHPVPESPGSHIQPDVSHPKGNYISANFPVDLHSIDRERQRIIKAILETTPELQESKLRYPYRCSESAFDELSQDDFHSENGHDIKSVDSSYCTPLQTFEDSSSFDVFSGVKREVSILLKENQDLVQTKNALNVVTSDLIGRIDDLTCENSRLVSERTALISHSTGMLSRIKDLEHECHRLRQELECEDMCDSICADSTRDDHSLGEDDLSPFSTRRCFSRLEMARVLLERNHYKEQLFDLQDAVRWTETLRAERQTDLSRTGKRRGTLWNWFSKLFTSSNSRQRSSIQPRSSTGINSSLNNSAGSLGCENVLNLERNGSSGHCVDTSSNPVTDDSHTPPSSFSNLTSDNLCKPVENAPRPDWMQILNPDSPGPVESFRFDCHFRPLADSLTGFKVWCAVSVQASIDPRNGYDGEHSPVHASKATHDTPNLLWVCSVATGAGGCDVVTSPRDPSESVDPVYSLINVYNMNEPYENLDSFAITTSTVLCMASVPAECTETQIHLSQTESYWDAIPLEQPTGDADTEATFNSPGWRPDLMDSLCWSTQSFPLSSHPSKLVKSPDTTQSCEWHTNSGCSKYSVERRHIFPASSPAPSPNSAAGLVTTAGPTIWMGCYNGDLYIHPAVTEWRTCLHVVHLPDAITQIRHFRGRVFISLANGQLVVFRRHVRSADGQVLGHWNLNEIALVSYTSVPSSIQPTIVVPSTDCIWSACRNRILVIETVTLQLINSFEIRSHNDAHVRHMSCTGKGIWIALRRLSMLQLFHAITHQHIQTVDLEPLVIGRLVDLKINEKPCRVIRPSSLAVTCLTTTDDHLWVGTNLGLIVRFPFVSQRAQPDATTEPLSVCDELSQGAPLAQIPEVQVSSHQHSGAVRFLMMLELSVTGRRLLVSGGRGYALRNAHNGTNHISEQSLGHVIVWKSID